MAAPGRKESLLLLITGLGLSLTSWAFWKYGNNDFLSVFATVGFVCVAADNVKLRRQLRALKCSKAADQSCQSTAPPQSFK